MRLKRARIRNYRSLRDVSIEFDNHTVLVGGNGTGKSSILRALELFFAPSAKVSDNDFYATNTTSEIDISITFDELSNDDLHTFSSNTHEDTLTIARVFSSVSREGKYFTYSLQHAPFSEIRDASTATGKRNAYNKIRSDDSSSYAALPSVTKADDIEKHLANWEAQHQNDLTWMRGNGFAGWSNVANGRLNRAVQLVFVPAVRDAAEDVRDAKGSPVAQLLEMVVQTAFLKRTEVQELVNDIRTKLQKILSPDTVEELTTLASSLSKILRQYYENIDISLSWADNTSFSLPFPKAMMRINEDAFEWPVEHVGHGLQRALILSLLQQLAGVDKHPQDEIDLDQSDINVTPHTTKDESCLLLVIEEPELYQHPSKQRHFARVLRGLSNGTISGVSERTQVIFATHSPLFISMEHFDEVRLIRRDVVSVDMPRMTVVSSTTLDAIARRLEQIHEKEPDSFSGKGLRARLHIFGSELCEGFFSDGVVLVEGASDVTALSAVADVARRHFLAKGIQVIAVGGKANLDKPALIFRALGIPTYVIWDTDKPDESKRRANKALLLLHGLTEKDTLSDRDHINSSWACFRKDLETTLKREIGERSYDKICSEVCDAYGVPGRNDAIKIPAVMIALISKAKERKHEFITLNTLVNQVYNNLVIADFRPTIDDNITGLSPRHT